MLLTERITERLKSLGRGQRTEEFWALRDVDFEVKRGETMGDRRAQRRRQEHLAEDPLPDHAADRGRSPPPWTGRRPARGRHRLPSGADRTRERLPQRGDPRHEARGDPEEIRRDRRVRRHGALHRHAGEALLERDADATGVLGRRPSRARDPDHRRGPLGRGPRLSGEVPGANGDRSRRGTNRRLHQSQPGLRSRPLRSRDHALRWPDRGPRQRLGRGRHLRQRHAHRVADRASGIARTASATGGCC